MYRSVFHLRMVSEYRGVRNGHRQMLNDWNFIYPELSKFIEEGGSLDQCFVSF